MERIKRYTVAVILTMAAVSASSSSFGQPSTTPPDRPATKLEAVTVEKGAVLIKGFETVAKILSGTGGVEMDVMSFTNAKTKLTVFGITLKIRAEQTCFIDADELDDFTRGLDYLRGVDRSVSRFKDFEVMYETKGGASVTAFSSSDGTIKLAVRCGQIGRAVAFLDIAKLDELAKGLSTAKEKIASAGLPGK